MFYILKSAYLYHSRGFFFLINIFFIFTKSFFEIGEIDKSIFINLKIKNIHNLIADVVWNILNFFLGYDIGKKLASVFTHRTFWNRSSGKSFLREPSFIRQGMSENYETKRITLFH